MFDLPIIMLGILLGLIIAVKAIGSSEEKRGVQRSGQSTGDSQNMSTRLPSMPAYTPTSVTFPRLDEFVPDILRDAAREARALQGAPRPIPSQQRQNGSGVVNGKSLLENWRRSIVGLLRLADSNLQAARSQATILNHKAAAGLAVTSVENVSRALLHCYGEKPDQNACQDEPLKLLVRRFQGEDKARFERAIGEAVQLNRSKMVHGYLSEKGIQAPLLNEVKAQEIIETATRIVAQFRQIIGEHFATEIPELGEMCPKCRALAVDLWTFGPQGSIYQCGICGHKWSQLTQ